MKKIPKSTDHNQPSSMAQTLMLKIDAVSNPVVGRYYMVLHAYGPRRHVNKTRKWWPIIGPWHEDSEILNFPTYHFHYDHRFTPEREWRCPTNQFSPVHGWALIDQSLDPEPTEPMRTMYLRRKMIRQMPDFPSDGRWRQALEAAYAGVRLKCRTCPHRGFSLDGLPVAPDGTVICPGHGLRWNLETGKLVPRDATTIQSLRQPSANSSPSRCRTGRVRATPPVG